MGKPTIRDVAHLAGVSPSTVSRSLRGQGALPEATSARIRDAAKRLGYSVSPAAYRLATGRTGTVAIVMPYMSRWFFAELLGGVEQVVRRAGLDLLLYHVGDAKTRQHYFSSGLLRKRVDGVLIATLHLTAPEIAALSSLDVPVCIVGAEVEGFFSVRIDDVESARTALQYLVNLGHEHVAILSGDPHEPMRFTVPLEQRAGYHQALERAGIEPNPALEAHGPFTVDGGFQATVKLLSRRRVPSAIFAESDEMAFGALRALRQASFRVPEDVSVVGFDDHPMASYFEPTTVAQDVEDQGRRAADLLVGAMGCPEADPVQERAHTELAVRKTTSSAGNEDLPARRRPGAPRKKSSGGRKVLVSTEAGAVTSQG